jgi:2-polyprenyl-3-methyl-5-hydroxy-6-metoxy-1,4-benzoquinol methylase
VIDQLALISPKYQVMQRILHAQPRGYGGRGDKWAVTVLALIAELEASSVLDYGCGQGSLRRAVMASDPPGVRFDEYDPAIPGKDGLPSFADLVVCTDVLEHIEPERLDAVLMHLGRLARKAVFAVISLKDSNKILADGRNAHLIQRPSTWWRRRLEAAGFTITRAPEVARKKKSHEWTVVLIPPAVLL